MLNSILDAITARFYSLFDFVTDPFWGWLFLALAIAAAVIAVTYFFGSYFPILRPIGGVILLLLTTGLYAYRKGEGDQKATDAKRAPKPKPKPPSADPWQWP